MLPNFLIVGAPKAGTTSLYYYLAKHPDVFMSSPKEVNFFSHEEIKSQNLYYQAFYVETLREYEKLFQRADGKIAIGEASVSYLFYKNVPSKIKSLLPAVKIIILLRNPIERAFSHYLMDYRMGLVHRSLEEIIQNHKTNKNNTLYYQQYIELGLYYQQIKRYLDLFNHNNVKIYVSEEFKNNPRELFQDISEFLEIEFIKSIETKRKYNSYKEPKNNFIKSLYSNYINSNNYYKLNKILPDFVRNSFKNLFFNMDNKPKLNEQTRNLLINLYNPEKIKLEQLLNKNLSIWK